MWSYASSADGAHGEEAAQVCYDLIELRRRGA
jgi:hypothetical protein